MLYDNILATIGKTPMVKLNSYTRKRAELYGKLEMFNPTGSVKDRAAFFMLEAAFKNGKINSQTTIIEPTSGNTGIGLAMYCAVKNLRLILTMPESMSIERVKTLRAYGAEVVLTERAKGMRGSIDKALSLQKEIGNAYIPEQFSNRANPNAHYITTAREIFTDLPNVKWIVSGVGSGGTVMGITRYIINNRLDCGVCVVEPEKSPLLSGGTAAPHGIQGIGANFIPPIIGDRKFDRIELVSDEEAIECSRELTLREGIFCGISAGANLAAAKRLLLENDIADIVVILPDNGLRYLSTALCDYD